MPRLIDTGPVSPVSYDAFAEALAVSPIDIRDEDGFASLAPLLARLGANRDFLAEAAIAALERSPAAKAGHGYAPQVLLLDSPDPRFVLRAAFWPAAGDAAMRASGGDAFVYGLTHNHNFAFLTHGYIGPGYDSDYWAFDPDSGASRPGDAAQLRFAGRYRLSSGTTMLVHAHRDVHRQMPPERFSVSLNILARPGGTPWQPQYRFDPARDIITGEIATLPSHALIALAAHCSPAGRDLAASFAQDHRCPRMRKAALSACCAARLPDAVRIAEGAASDGATALARHARALLGRSETDQSTPVQDRAAR
ncbi:transposase [Stakelama pacifica]|uniref:Uncharacterized protein n=1 Tax=Stakelama pacifica TaxID=517720 RepID=A0A4R6FUZ1_9SPHN|nr:transposase [Stakelama pacifica]TDN85709.1 hypothetical protein EV664_102419 [Stakelama pacifica]GGO91858.1 hypothetical protein GCM10011329_07530 [Stakelama pacifica]